MGVIRKTFGASFGLPAPEWLLAAGAVVIGTETELILKSRWVVPEGLLASGFIFQFPGIAEAVKDILYRK